MSLRTDETGLNDRVDELTNAIKGLRERLDTSLPADEFASVKAQLDGHKSELSSLMEDKLKRDQEAEAKRLREDVDALLKNQRPASKAAAIFGGVYSASAARAEPEESWGKALKAMMLARTGDQEAFGYLKATLGYSPSTGQSIIPNNEVAKIVEIATALNPYRNLLTVITGVRGKGVDIPTETDAPLRATVIGAGSNKENVDFFVGTFEARLYTIGRIIDVGNQFLRQSEGAAEQLVRSKLGRAFALGEAYYVLNGSGSSEPTGLITALAAPPPGPLVAGNLTTTTGTERATKIANALATLENRSYQADGGVMNPVDFWETVSELSSGRYLVSPQAGASLNVSGGAPLNLWGLPFYRDPNMTAGTAIIGEWKAAQLFVGDEYRIDVSNEAGDRWDQNLTGFRAEEEIAFNANPYVRQGMFQRITGL